MLFWVNTAGLMANPALFEGKHHDPCDLALEFVDICLEHPVTAVVARGIIVKMLLPLFAANNDQTKPHRRSKKAPHMKQTEHKSTTTCARSL